MEWRLEYTPEILPIIFTALLLIVLAVYSARRHKVPGALPFTIACLFATGVAVSSLMESFVVDIPSKIVWFKVQGAWNIPVVTAITFFFLEYAWPGRWLNRRNLVLLSIPCFLALGFILTNDLHYLLWRRLEFQGSVKVQDGPIGWLFVFYGFGVLGVLNLVACGWLFLRSQQQRWPVAIMLVGQIGGRVLFLVDRANLLSSFLPLDLLSMAFEFLMYAIALYNFHILDPISLARTMAIEQLHVGMLVLDLEGKIVNLNPAASTILGLPVKRLLGNSIESLLPAFAEVAGDLQAEGISRIEIEIGKKLETHYCQLESSSLQDWRGIQIGRLLMLRDVTEIKQAEAQLFEHQRSLAMLQEREQLARELHDSLGQVLGYASLKMGATRKLIADGKLAKADDQLAHLESSLTEVHADVREYILNLRITPIREKPFFSTLRNYLDGFHQNYGINVDVAIGLGMSEDDFTMEMKIQLFRILQEALSNARKHAATNYIKISFGMEDGRLCMRVQDNGKGFDPLQVSGAGSGHFGLSIMRERAELLGGSLEVQSIPGEGTYIEVEVPSRGKVETT
jgi:PAS domain S-box-containing protein